MERLLTAISRKTSPHLRHLMIAVPGAILALVVAAAALVDAPSAPGSWAIALGLLAVAAALTLLGGRLAPGGLARPAVFASAAGAALAALCALYGPNPLLHLTPFEGANPAFFGLPSALPFLLLGLGAWVVRRDLAPSTHAEGADDAGDAALATDAQPAPSTDAGPQPLASPLGRGLVTVGLLWASAVLLLPEMVFGATAHPLPGALASLLSPDPLAALRGLTLVLCGLGVAAGWWWALHPRARAGPPPRSLWLGAGALIAYHPLAGLAGGAALPGLLIGAALGLGILTAAALLRCAPELGPRHLALGGRALTAVALGLPLTLFALLKTHGLGPSNTDENIYFYMAAALADGRLPYVDYFFAHPPLHVLIPGAFFAVFGFSLTFAKLFSVVAAMVTAVAIFAIGRRHLGLFAATLAMVLFLFATENLKASTNMTGINLTTMWMTLGMWASLRGRPLLAGALFGCAATTGFYSMAAICAFLAVGFFRWPEEARRVGHRLAFGLRQLLAFAAVAGSVNLLFWLAAGEQFIEGVYTYHSLKAVRDPQMVEVFGDAMAFPGSLIHNIAAMVAGKEYTRELFYHAHLWMGLALAPCAGLALWLRDPGRRRRLLGFLSPVRLHRDGGDGVAGILWLAALALFVQYAMFRELYSFYWVLIYPTLALSVAYLVLAAARLAREAISLALPQREAVLRLALAATLLTAFGYHRPWGAAAQSAFGDEVDAAGSRVDYTWSDPPVLPALGGVVRELFWQDYRLKAQVEAGYRHYLWTKTRTFSTIDAIGEWVRSNSSPEDTLAGASTATPIIALYADRRIAAGHVDTNNKRFRSGLLTEADFWNDVCADNVRFIVSTPRSYFTHDRMTTLPTVRRWFRPVQRFDDPELAFRGSFPIVIYERVGEPPGPGRVCQWEEPGT